jgi:hypothetical protein
MGERFTPSRILRLGVTLQRVWLIMKKQTGVPVRGGDVDSELNCQREWEAGLGSWFCSFSAFSAAPGEAGDRKALINIYERWTRLLMPQGAVCQGRE